MKISKPLIAAAALMLAGTAVAQVEIDKRRPAGARPSISIDNSFGSVTITGWDQSEVRITGRLAAGAEGLDLDGDHEDVDIGVEEPESWFFATRNDEEYQTHLEISVPRGASLKIETLNAQVIIRGVEGAIEVETVNGAVIIEAASASVEVESMTGSVDITARGAAVSVETISGAVKVLGAAESLEVNSVIGRVEVSGSRLQEVELETTSGEILFSGSLADEGCFSLKTFSGAVTLALPPAVKAHFDITTFGGTIQSELGPAPSREGGFLPHRKLRFATGADDYDVTVETYSGDIILRLDAAAGSGPGDVPPGDIPQTRRKK